MLREPTARVDVVKVACPDPLSEPEPSVLAPSLKVTVPNGIPPLELTTAVNITDCPNADGLIEEETVVVVAAGFTV